MPSQWSDAASTADMRIRSWCAFDDPQLESLVRRAVERNLDVALACARVREARAQRDVASAGLLPTIDVHGSAQRTQLSEKGPFGEVLAGQATPGGPARPAAAQGLPGSRFDLFDIGFDAAWEIDLFGHTASAIEAAEAGVDAANEARREALVTLAGEVARNYVELRGAQHLLEITRANLRASEDALDVARTRARTGLAPEFDVSRARGQSATTAAAVPQVEDAIARSMHRLGVLLGDAPGAVAAELRETKPVPVAPAPIPTEIPSDLLRRRPDIRRAERELAQAAALTNEATADLFPRVSLTGSLGRQSTKVGDLTDPASRTWSFGPSISWPIFDAGAARARVRVEDAREEEAYLRYRQTVITALAEVEDALSAVARERERHARLAEAVLADRQAYEDARLLHDTGIADFRQVLDAERAKLLAETEEARSATALAGDEIALFKALGGGWQAAESDR